MRIGVDANQVPANRMSGPTGLSCGKPFPLFHIQVGKLINCTFISIQNQFTLANYFALFFQVCIIVGLL
jgi:hypothetical protein